MASDKVRCRENRREECMCIISTLPLMDDQLYIHQHYTHLCLGGVVICMWACALVSDAYLYLLCLWILHNEGISRNISSKADYYF